MFFLMLDINNKNRATKELQTEGYGIYLKTLFVTIAITLYLILSIMVVIIHLVSQSSFSKIPNITPLPKAMMCREIPAPCPEAESTPVRSGRDLDMTHDVSVQQDTDHRGYVQQDMDYCGHVQLDMDHGGRVQLYDDQELENSVAWRKYSAASFPDDQIDILRDVSEKQHDTSFVDDEEYYTAKDDQTVHLSNVSIGSGFD